MATLFSIQPQRVAVGTFLSPQGSEVPVYMTQPWYRALEALSKVQISADGTLPGSGISFDALPAYQYGDIVFASGTNALRRLAPGPAGQALLSQGPGAAPVWADLPAAPAPSPAPAPAPLVLYALTGAAMLTLAGKELTLVA